MRIEPKFLSLAFERLTEEESLRRSELFLARIATRVVTERTKDYASFPSGGASSDASVRARIARRIFFIQSR